MACLFKNSQWSIFKAHVQLNPFLHPHPLARSSMICGLILCQMFLCVKFIWFAGERGNDFHGLWIHFLHYDQGMVTSAAW